MIYGIADDIGNQPHYMFSTWGGRLINFALIFLRGPLPTECPPFSFPEAMGVAQVMSKGARSREALKPTVIHQARRVHRRGVKASGTAERCSI
jgi:hypothetical protein